MLVAKIIFGLVVLWVIYIMLKDYRDEIYDKFHYNIFNKNIFIMIVISYVSIFVGNKSYIAAVADHGDKLNGILLFIVAAILIVVSFIMNLEKTDVENAIYITVIQLALGIAIIGFLILAIFSSLAAYDSRYNRYDY